MNYCSIEDIQKIVANGDLIALTNDSGGDTIDTEKITDAISYVTNIINGYLRGRYSLPISHISDELRFIAADFTVYRLYSRRMYTEMPASITDKYKNVIKFLEQIQQGTFNIGAEKSDAFNNPTLKTNKNNFFSSVNKHYNQKKWDKYDA